MGGVSMDGLFGGSGPTQQLPLRPQPLPKIEPPDELKGSRVDHRVYPHDSGELIVPEFLPSDTVLRA